MCTTRDDMEHLSPVRFAGLIPSSLCLLALFASGTVSTAAAQETAAETTVPLVDQEKPLDAPERVEVAPMAVDEDISDRLESIFNATGWFENVEVTTDEGVVFLNGLSKTKSHQEWAERVAQRTSDVVAVVNRIEVLPASPWNIEPAIDQLRMLGSDFITIVPLLVVGAFVVLLAFFLARIFGSLARRLTARRVDSQLLQQVTGSLIAVLVTLVGIYIALKVSGLSRLAVTVLGGTGLIGLALGFAFRDIAENYLASILISLNRPFSVGDLIEVEGRRGFVRRVTTRGTLLLTIDGNHIQIPNSTVYKSIVINFSSSPRIRKEFSVGIGYDDSVTQAQEIIYSVLTHHEAVLQDPAPTVLVDTLGASTVNLITRFWIDSKRFDPLSVLSALMRQSKTALASASISMPDEAREVVFPQGVPVAMIANVNEAEDTDEAVAKIAEKKPKPTHAGDNAESSTAEGNLTNKDETIQNHAASREMESGENLIE